MMRSKKILSYLAGGNDRELFDRASGATLENCGNKVIIRGLIEFSNYCCRNCLYCGLRGDNQGVRRYRMTPREILDRVEFIDKLGIKTVVLQSGDDFFYTRECIKGVIEGIKKINPQMAVTLSLGERPRDDYKAFRDSGADRYLLKHETINNALYSSLHPGQSLANRLRILDYLKKLDYQVGIGNIIGLPGQSLRDFVEEIIFIRDSEPDMIGISPFIAQKDTPLSRLKQPDINLTLRFYALARIVSRKAHIPATTAIGTLDRKEGCRLAIKAGANVLMANFTPNRYIRDYIIYDDKNSMDFFSVYDTIVYAGREVSLERGDSLRAKHALAS